MICKGTSLLSPKEWLHTENRKYSNTEPQGATKLRDKGNDEKLRNNVRRKSQWDKG